MFYYAAILDCEEEFFLRWYYFFTRISSGPLSELLYEAHKERLKGDIPHSFD